MDPRTQNRSLVVRWSSGDVQAVELTFQLTEAPDVEKVIRSSMHHALHVQRGSADYMQRALQSFRASLRARQLKVPKGREAIARCALEQSGAFTVLDLVRALKSEGIAGAHAVTVYRTMPLLVESGLLRETAAACGDSRFYEVAFEREIRPLLNCRECRRAVELNTNALIVLEREAEQLGFELDVSATRLLGRCRDCSRLA